MKMSGQLYISLLFQMEWEDIILFQKIGVYPPEYCTVSLPSNMFENEHSLSCLYSIGQQEKKIIQQYDQTGEKATLPTSHPSVPFCLLLIVRVTNIYTVRQHTEDLHVNCIDTNLGTLCQQLYFQSTLILFFSICTASLFSCLEPLVVGNLHSPCCRDSSA